MKQDASSSVLDPPRLLGGGSAREQQLLQSARWDTAPGGARERMAAVLGPVLGNVLGNVPGNVPGDVPGPVPVLSSEGGSGRGELPRAVFTPRAALLGLAGAGIAAYLLASLLSPRAAVPQDRPEPQLAPLVDGQPVSSGGRSAVVASPDLAEGAPVLQEPAPQRQHRVPSAKIDTANTGATPPQRGAGKRAAVAESAGTLLEEVHLLDTIRSALRAGELPTAQRALAQYDRRFPSGELHNEKSVLALDLLLARGQQEPARARARQLLEQPGMQRYSARLRAIVAGSSASGSDPGDAHIRARR
jgi:hypothetical protein